jgi:peptidoglycan/xylan/chitin deacetylase (PgdA/CDA1 family)
MVMIPLAAAVIATVGNFTMEKEISNLSALISTYEEFKNDGKEFSPADFYVLMEHLGVKKEDFFALLYKRDPNILGVLGDHADEQPTNEIPGDDENEPPPIPGASMLNNSGAPAEGAYLQKPLPEYSNLYLDLYVEGREEPTPRDKDDKGYIYLTFDDGPSENTSNILSYLKMHDVSATFFVIPGKNNSWLLNMILKNGHEIGIHSASHDYYEIYSSVEAFLADFKKAHDLIYEQTGTKPNIFRFPGGSRNRYNGDVCDDIIAEMTRRGFIYFDWNVDSKDQVDANWTQIYNTVLDEVAYNTARGNRSIILMHDRPGGMNTVLVVEDIIIALLKDPNGYKFGRLGRNVKPIQF